MEQSASVSEKGLRDGLPTEIALEADNIGASQNGTARVAAFGIWPEVEDGLAYQERLRSEWDERASGCEG